MEYNSPVEPPGPRPDLSEGLSIQLTHFIAKLRYFLSLNASLHPQLIRNAAGGRGFVIYAAKQSKQVDQLLEHVFNFGFQPFVREARRLGFSIKNKNTGKGQATSFMFREKVFQQSQSAANVDFQSFSQEQRPQEWRQQEEQDQFPKEQEVQVIMTKKEERSFAKPSIILNKVMSEGNSGLPDWRKNDDASIEVKLEEQAEIFATHKNEAKGEPQSAAELNGSILNHRSLNQKENYQKCAKIIDSTIIEFLQAHRNNKLEVKKEQLMNNIAEIYDILSNSIDNIGGVVQLFAGKQPKKEEIGKADSPEGFSSVAQN